MSATSVEEVLTLFERFGTDAYDEEIGQLDHALQTASLAVADGADDALVAAALLHDVGHLLDLAAGRRGATSDLRHEEHGAAWLRPLLPAAVSAPIALHVRAKRYLCAVDETYLAILSPGSVRSLERQGGPMGAAEVAQFEHLPHHDDAVRLRRWDDGGKIAGLDVAPLEHYRALLERLVAP